MERMRNKDLENAWAVQGIRQEKCAKLEEEIKKLNIIIENTKKEQKSDRKHIEQLEEENKKLKEELSKYKKQYEHSMGEDDELIYEEGLYD